MFIIEGNIGVGKSTFLKQFRTLVPTVETAQESLQNWTTQTDGTSILELFYTNPSRWTYTLETLIMMSRSKYYIEKQNATHTIFMERSVYSGHYCFARAGKEDGNFKPVEWSMYETWVDFFFENQCKPPKGFIYLQAEPNVCFDRIKKRSRKGEESISLEYLKKIDHKHTEFLIEKKQINKQLHNVPILTLDCNEDLLRNKETFNLYLNKTKEFINRYA